MAFFGTAAAAIAVGIARDPKGLRRSEKMAQEAQALAVQNDALAAENVRLAREVDALQHDRRYQARAVREELGWVRPGQLILQLDEPEATTAVAPLPDPPAKVLRAAPSPGLSSEGGEARSPPSPAANDPRSSGSARRARSRSRAPAATVPSPLKGESARVREAHVEAASLAGVLP